MANTTSITDESFEKDVLQASIPVLVDFWAPWCGPCRLLDPKLEEIAGEMRDRIRIVKLNVDENPSVSAKYDVSSIPRIILFKNGQEIDKIVGVTPKENIIALLEKHS